MHSVTEDHLPEIVTPMQGGHGTGKTGNLVINFSRQGKHMGNLGTTQGKFENHREFSKFPQKLNIS